MKTIRTLLFAAFLLSSAQLEAQIITTIAGTGTGTYAGDGGPATAANINPVDIAFDGTGNIYIADQGNARVRKISTTGIITTIAGSGLVGYSGDGGGRHFGCFRKLYTFCGGGRYWQRIYI
jgi:hypothetical protein